MRQTCLKCGHQVDLAVGESVAPQVCVCGRNFGRPCAVEMGVEPSVRAAEQLRARAFRAAGLVRNLGGFALAVSAVGLVLFPVGLLGLALGVWVLVTLRGPLGRYGGRTAAVWAIVLGATTFVVEGAVCLAWMQHRRAEAIVALQQTASEDLRDLLRAQRLLRATTQHFGGFSELNFRPRHGLYTLYLGPDEVLPARRAAAVVQDVLPANLPTACVPYVTASAFVAVAVANLDEDPELDVWTVDAAGDIVHVRSDAGQP